MKTLLAITLVILAASQATNGEHHDEHNHQHKKDQAGFFGSRGKRSVNTDHPVTNEVDESNEATLKELTNLRDSLMGYQRNVRAPKGFFGMRGKKDYDLQFAQKRALLGMQQNSNGRERQRFVDPQQQANIIEAEFANYESLLPKRAPSQAFFGMRGKKFGDYDLSGQVNDKRAPKGFMGMRGKKSSDDEETDDFDYNWNDKRAPSGFFGMRGKKLFTEDKMPANLMFR